MTDYLTHCGATAGRGSYQSAVDAGRWLLDARSNLARLLGASQAHDIAICHSGTHALNAGLWGVLRPGDHVITTSAEHNSVLRPLFHWQERMGLEVSIVQCDASGTALADDAIGLIRANTKLIAIGHASNVTGKVQRLEPWSQLAHAHGLILMVDASQTLGYLPLNVEQESIDILASAGHKGLRALTGTGLLYVSPKCQTNFMPLMLGGTGQASEQVQGLNPWPLSVEVGNLNMAGVVSLAVAARELLESPDGLSDAQGECHWKSRLQSFVMSLRAIDGLEIVGYSPPFEVQDRIPVVSVRADGWDVHDLANILDTAFGIEARAGLHCAALIHQDLGDQHNQGTLRFSMGHTTSAAAIAYTVDALRQILAEEAA